MGRRDKKKRELKYINYIYNQIEKNEDPTYIEKVFINECIGFGVFAKRNINCREFIAEYVGDLIPKTEGDRRHAEDCKEEIVRSYFYFFTYKKKKLCIDATQQKNRICRYVNDSKHANCKMELLEIDHVPHLCLIANEEIHEGDEIRYDYNSKDLPWRKKTFSLEPQTSKNEFVLPLHMNDLQINEAVKETVGELIGKTVEISENEDLLAELGRGLKNNDTNIKTLCEKAGCNEEDHDAESEENICFDIKRNEKQMSCVFDDVTEKELSKGKLGTDSITELNKKEVKEKGERKRNTNVVTNSNSENESDKVLQESLSLPKKASTRRPPRPCVFCNTFQTNLRRHLLRCHRDQKQLKNFEKLTPVVQNSVIANLKKEGIKKHNLQELQKKEPKLCHERAIKGKKASVKSLIMCSECCGFFWKKSFRRHRWKCSVDGIRSTGVATSNIKYVALSKFSKPYKECVISSLRDDEIGQFVKKNKLILIIGGFLFEKVKRKQSKQIEISKSVRQDMRQLASLYAIFRKEENVTVSNDIRDLFRQQNFPAFQRSVEEYVAKDGGKVKSGLKYQLLYLVKNTCKILKGYSLIKKRNDDVSTIENFLAVLELLKDCVFGDATYQLKSNRRKKLRKPHQLPEVDDIMTLRRYLLRSLKELTNPFVIVTQQTYILLRKVVCARLTLYNGRRGGEPARLTLAEAQEGLDDAWLSKSDLKNLREKTNMKIAYQEGKGEKDVPVLFPEDTIKAIEMLACQQNRKDAGVLASNSFLFACTKSSRKHQYGWEAIFDTARLAGVNPTKMTATKNRHFVSTEFAKIDTDRQEKDQFFKHMGHSKDVNENVYQVPPAMNEILLVGSRLEQLDRALSGTPKKNSRDGDCGGEENVSDESSCPDGAVGESNLANGDSGDNIDRNNLDNGDNYSDAIIEEERLVESNHPDFGSPKVILSDAMKPIGNHVKPSLKRKLKRGFEDVSDESMDDNHCEDVIQKKYPLRKRKSVVSESVNQDSDKEPYSSSDESGSEYDVDEEDDTDNDDDLILTPLKKKSLKKPQKKFIQGVKPKPPKSSEKSLKKPFKGQKLVQGSKSQTPKSLKTPLKIPTQTQDFEVPEPEYSKMSMSPENYQWNKWKNRNKARGFCAWTPTRSTAFFKNFGDYIYGAKNSEYPTKDEMQSFLASNDINFSCRDVRVKICNEKEKQKRLLAKRKRDLAIE